MAQVAAFPDGRVALRQDMSVIEALQALAGGAALSEEARQHAQSALLALSDHELQVNSEGQQHVMLSCKSCFICSTPALLIAHPCVHMHRPVVRPEYDAENQRVTDLSWIRDLV